MPYGEFTKIRQGLLLLTGAVLQLIITALHLDQRFKRERDLLAYHRTKQIELLNQLYEIIHLRIGTLFGCGQLTPSDSEIKEMKVLEAWISELLIELLNLSDIGELPKQPYILSLERLRNKLIPSSVIPGVSPAANALSVPSKKSPEVYVEREKITKSVVNPILHWTKEKSKTTQVTSKKKARKAVNTLKIQIGTQMYTVE
ncbi:hypothetical protein M5W83_27615 [Paenibacillus thiaminolyticus]|uniref:Uncharacterized protein n=1 Tax=Paenibacillus thiaminolyticus TaxID=49283 RepID=A0AAP9DTQ0_PANTH|nr:hypothetical protein [Paenibacillus thiaminolyticus]MCY9538274.1 hypothetical protein [Paenibacillus thiaminolyticus]MCY9604477.1 hypothetical protein [Paenibacillus thiaminolyticus]MCY9610918.1 hypothetical protein [Paenibacillus thiaminolyticus]MCY9616798.1 hypothetical protein [Paenibacillus thiaminolyticus]MCY9622424.1 hypothetical protein [Paenibacillus thiaminolyticus]